MEATEITFQRIENLLKEYELWGDYNWNHEVQVESVLRKMCENLKSYQDMADAIEKIGEGVDRAILALEKADDELEYISDSVNNLGE